MPLVRISLLEGRTPAQRHAIGDAVHQALVDTIDVPRKVQVTISAGRPLEKKRALFRGIADNLAALGLRREDVWINLVEVAKENWSFGNGVASYAPAEAVAA